MMGADDKDRTATEERLHRMIRVLRVLSSINFTKIMAGEEEGLLEDVCRVLMTKGEYAGAWIGFSGDGGIVPEVMMGDVPTGDGAVEDIPPQLEEPLTTLSVDGPARLVLPLPIDAGPIGFMGIYSRDTEPFGEEEVEMLMELAEDLTYRIMALRVERERKRLEKETLEAKDELIESMKRHREYVLEVADRLRNPLQVVKGALEFLEEEGMPEEQQQQMSTLKKAIEDLEKGIKALT